jgi:hypothetical protein
VQEVPWVYKKAKGLMEQRPTLTWDDALGIAKKTYKESMPETVIHATDEYIPGAGTGHQPELVTATPEAKLGYTNTMQDIWSPGGRDLVGDEMGLLQSGQQTATGRFTPHGGQTETSPVVVTRMHGGMAKEPAVNAKGEPILNRQGAQMTRETVDPVSGRLANARANFVGYSRDQNMAAASRPIWEDKATLQNSMFIPRNGPVTPQQLDQLEAAGGQHGLPHAVDYGNGVLMTSFNPAVETNGSLMKKSLKKGLQGQLDKIFGGPVKPQLNWRWGTSADYQDALAAGNEGKGVATRQFLAAADKDPTVYGLLDTPKVANAMGRYADAEDATAGLFGRIRPDIQNMRRIWAANPGRGIDALREGINRGEYLPGLAVAGLLGAAAGAPQFPAQDEDY